MIEEIELGGIKVPLRDLEITPESIKQVLKILLEERNKTKNRRARRETKQELEKLINAAIEEWIWSQRGQKRESEEKAIKADSGKRKGRAEAVRSGRMRDSTGRKAK
jgi:hypothetical protein